MSRIKFNELSSCEVRRLNQLETADTIRIGLAVLHAWLNREYRLWIGFDSDSTLHMSRAKFINKFNYGSSARISTDRILMHFYLLLNSVRLELRSASESIQPV